MFTSATTLIAALSGMGIQFSAVKSIAENSNPDTANQLRYTVVTLRRWLLLTGIVGMLAMIFLSSFLSRLSFGSDAYVLSFLILSITILFQSLTNAQLAILQGLRQLKKLAIANLSGAVISLCCSIPLYLYFKKEGLIPALLISSVIPLIMVFVQTRKITIKPLLVSWRRSFYSGIEMVKLGFIMTLSGFITMAIMYLIRVYIGNVGGIGEVGLYAAAWTILNSYIDLIFTAMSTDYFPSLSALQNDHTQFSRRVNEQAEMMILLLTPILLVLFTFLPLVIKILLSDEFLPVIHLLMWALAGVLFKAASWCLGYILLAKGKRKSYFISELVGSFCFLVINITAYHFWGITGIGIAYLINYLLYLVFISVMVKSIFTFSFQSVFARLFFINLFFLFLALGFGLIIGYPIAFWFIGILTLCSIFFSIYELNKRIQIKPVYLRIRSQFFS
ncbi:MAG: oligosaccharide flippase family protein [Bacteroidetes bacterium]|nr:oligosaccharide flippase family protein [Bacteroidota bacterium]